MSSTLSLSLDVVSVPQRKSTYAASSAMLSPTSEALEQAMRVPSPDVEESSSSEEGDSSDSSDGDELFGCDGLEEDESLYGSSHGTAATSPSSFAGDNRRHASSTFRLGSAGAGASTAASDNAKLRALSLRSPSLALRHEAALRSFQIKATSSPPPACPLPPSPSSSRTASSAGDVLESLRLSDEHYAPLFRHDEVLEPRIEIEQDCDDDESDDAWSQARSPPLDIAEPLSGRQAASQRMLSALSRSPAKVAVGAPPRRALPKLHGLSARRTSTKALPSLEQITLRTSIAGVGTPAPCALTPAPRTPGTASPQPRSVSCPTALPRKQYGAVEVYITPPTPRPPQGAIHGVVLARPGLPTRANSTPDVLTVPAFDMAPGRARMEKERERMAALQLWNAWQDQARLSMGSPLDQKAWREHANVNPWLVQLQMLAGLGSPAPATSADLSSSPARADSPKGMQRQQQQQRTMPRAPRRGSADAAQSTWWRAPSSAPIATTPIAAKKPAGPAAHATSSPPPSAPACVAVPMSRVAAERRSSPPPQPQAQAQAQATDARAAARTSMLLKLGKRASVPAAPTPSAAV